MKEKENHEQPKEADRFSETIKIVAVAGGASRIIRAVFFAAFLIAIGVILRRSSLPIYLSIVLFALVPLILLYEIISLRRMFLFQKEQGFNQIVGELAADEKIVDIIPAVMRYDKIRTVEVMGVGKVIHPENLLIVTNHALWALRVPFEGEDMSIRGADGAEWHWLITPGEIADRFDEMGAQMSLHELFAACNAKRIASREELVSVETVPGTYALLFRTRSGESFGYAIRDRSDYLRTKTLFRAIET